LNLNSNLTVDSMMTDHSSAAKQSPLDTPSGDASGADAASTVDLRLTDVSVNEVVELVRFEMPADQIEPLLERGVLPGCRVCPVRRSPSGDPIIDVDGVMLALRRETAGCICVKRFSAPAD
jgi:Fe2+ transport system protein FeoA